MNDQESGQRRSTRLKITVVEDEEHGPRRSTGLKSNVTKGVEEQQQGPRRCARSYNKSATKMMSARSKRLRGQKKPITSCVDI